MHARWQADRREGALAARSRHHGPRSGAWISGALIAEAEPLTNGLIVGTPALMVHYVSPGSDAESAGLMLYDLILSADGSAVDSATAFLTARPHETAPPAGRWT